MNRLIMSNFGCAVVGLGIVSSVRAACTKPIVPPFHDNVYYQAAVGQTGTALRSALHDIMTDHTRHTYQCVWDIPMESDEDPSNSNNVILLYTERSTPKSNRDQGQNDPDSWNRERVWVNYMGFTIKGNTRTPMLTTFDPLIAS